MEKKRVSKWDASGQYECAFGSFGQGPGEFMSLEGLFIHEDGRIFLNDQGRALVVFMEDGSFLQRISLSQHLASDFFVDGQDNIFGLLIQFSPEAMHGQLAKLDPKGNLISIFSGESPPNLLGKSGVMGGLIHSFSPRPYICRV
ncbi:MAG: 6-bladed beta-propeller, partial [Planctomycetes bacterium]|nr:6-bladed beta-propeller [Planctomycetota bacterium]